MRKLIARHKTDADARLYDVGEGLCMIEIGERLSKMANPIARVLAVGCWELLVPEATFSKAKDSHAGSK